MKEQRPMLTQVILRETRRLWPVAAVELILAVLLSYISVVMMNLVNGALAGRTESVKGLALQLFILGLALVPFRLIYSKISTEYIKNSLINFRQAYLKRLFKKDISEFKSDNNAVYLSQLTNDINTLEQVLFQPQLTFLNAVMTIVSVFVVLGIYSPITIIIACVTLGLGGWLAVKAGEPTEKPQSEKSLLLENYTAYIREVLSAFPIIKNNNLDSRVTKNFERASRAVQDKNYELDKEITWSRLKMELSIGLAGLVLMGFMVWYVNRTGLGAGGAVLLITAFGRIAEPLLNVSAQLPLVRSVRPLLGKMEKALRNKRAGGETVELGELKEGIRFDHVGFVYADGDRNTVLEDINYFFEMNKKYLIVGPSGGGKSTLLKLIRKLERPTAGHVYADGEDLDEVKNESYFRQMASVEQQVFLFDDTVRSNITLFKDYSEEELSRAIRGAGLDTVIDEFPDGLDQMIRGNGSNISGGQKARIAIARALISRAKILVLDEAFASLDEQVARQIEETILNLEDVMVLQVSHVVFRDTMHRYDACIRVADRGIEEV